MLRPRALVKLSDEKILHRQQDFELISEVILERMSTMCQCGTQFRAHRAELHPRVASAEVMPHTEPDRVLVLVGGDANPAPVLGDVLDGSPAIHVASQQARQAATKYLDDPQPLALVLENARSFTDH